MATIILGSHWGVCDPPAVVEAREQKSGLIGHARRMKEKEN